MNSSANTKKMIITRQDKKFLDEINLKRDMIKDGIVWEGVVVSIRIWLPNNCPEGVVDICTPVSEDNSFGFKDKWDAIISKDIIGVYRLSERGENKDIPKQFYSPIEESILIPLSMGAIVPYNDHVYGKGVMYKIAKIRSKEWRLVLEDVEIISPFENAIFAHATTDESLPKAYEKNSNQKKTDYKSLINEGENENVEFKSSARWDYMRNCQNITLQKEVLKSLAGFLNSNGGFLFIGIDDDKNILGIQKDLKTLGKQNFDGYQLLLSNLICANIGKQFSSYIAIEFPKIDEHTICVMKIENSKTPAFLKENNMNKFYIRTNNSTRELDPKETHEYIISNFK